VAALVPGSEGAHPLVFLKFIAGHGWFSYLLAMRSRYIEIGRESIVHAKKRPLDMQPDGCLF
jgi:hypothetical protein